MEWTPEVIAEWKERRADDRAWLSVLCALEEVLVNEARFEKTLLTVERQILSSDRSEADRLESIQSTVRSVLHSGLGSRIMQLYRALQEENARLQTQVEYYDEVLGQYMQIDNLLRTAQEHISRVTEKHMEHDFPHLFPVNNAQDGMSMEDTGS